MNKTIFSRAAVFLMGMGTLAGLAIAQMPPKPAAGVKDIEQLPGLYIVAGRGADVGTVFLVLTPEPVLIDCGSRIGWDQLAGNLKLLGLSLGDVRWVIATHGHWDHIDAMARIQREFPGVKFAVHAGDAQFVINNDRVFSCAEPLYKGAPSDPIKVDRILLDGDTVEAGKSVFRIVHTPGHTPGSIVVITDIDGKKVAFCGDAAGGYYALLNRSSAIDWQSSMKKLMAMDIDRLYTGHGRRAYTDKADIHTLLQTAYDAASFKRKQQERDESYQNLAGIMRQGK